MATVTRKPRRVKPATGICSLTLTINETAYTVVRLHPDPEVASLAFRLRKADGAAYDIRQCEHGAECSCPDWIFSRDGGKDPQGCKHIRALRAWTLLPALPAPAPAPADNYDWLQPPA